MNWPTRSCRIVFRASEILDTDREFADSLRTAIAQLPPIQLRANGAIREWFEDFESTSQSSSYTSHLLALYPFSQITLEKTPRIGGSCPQDHRESFVCRELGRYRMESCQYDLYVCRLKDAQEAYKSVQLLQGKLSRENLMTVFQVALLVRKVIFIRSMEILPVQLVWQKCGHTES